MGGLGGMGAMNPQEMMNNPELMNQMMENPLVRQMMDVSFCLFSSFIIRILTIVEC